MTQRTKHTPGPWGYDAQGYINAETPAGKNLVTAVPICKMMIRDNTRQNARLIVAAPEMRDLIIEAMDIIGYQLAREVSSMTASQQEFMNKAQGILSKIAGKE